MDFQGVKCPLSLKLLKLPIVMWNYLGSLKAMCISGWSRAFSESVWQAKKLKEFFYSFPLNDWCLWIHISLSLQERQQLTKASPFNIIKLFYCTYCEGLTSVAWTNWCSNYVSIHPARIFQVREYNIDGLSLMKDPCIQTRQVDCWSLPNIRLLPCVL